MTIYEILAISLFIGIFMFAILNIHTYQKAIIMLKKQHRDIWQLLGNPTFPSTKVISNIFYLSTSLKKHISKDSPILILLFISKVLLLLIVVFFIALVYILEFKVKYI
jgi:hypothetical protein